MKDVSLEELAEYDWVRGPPETISAATLRVCS